MQYSCGIQISDLEAIQPDFKQKLTTEEAEKVVGGITSAALTNAAVPITATI